MSKGITKAVSLIVSLFLVSIAVFALLCITDIKDSEVFVPAVVFGCISYVLLILRSAVGDFIQKAVGVPMAIGITVSTAFYALAVFVLSAMTYRYISVEMFLLVNLILAFLYFCSVSAIGIIGNKNKK